MKKLGWIAALALMFGGSAAHAQQPGTFIAAWLLDGTMSAFVDKASIYRSGETVSAWVKVFYFDDQVQDKVAYRTSRVTVNCLASSMWMVSTSTYDKKGNPIDTVDYSSLGPKWTIIEPDSFPSQIANFLCANDIETDYADSKLLGDDYPAAAAQYIYDHYNSAGNKTGGRRQGF